MGKNIPSQTPEIEHERPTAPLESAAGLERSTEKEQQKVHLTNFLLGTKEIKGEEKSAFFEKTKGWNQINDIKALRAAGLTAQENKENRTRRHILLSSIYLEEIPDSPELQFKVDFKDNSLAERKVGAGDLLPTEVTAIKVQNASGSLVSSRAIRGIDRYGRIGYYDALSYEYVPVFSGDTITVLESEHEKAKTTEERAAEESTAFERGQTVTPVQYPWPEELPRENIDRDFWKTVCGDSPEAVEPFIDHNVRFLGARIGGGVNQLMVPYLAEAEARITQAGIDYQIKDVSCTNWRKVRGGNALSYHSWGVAIDINPEENPMGEHLETDLPPEFVKIMKECGFRWGGDFATRKDAMHFELNVNPYTATDRLTNEQAKMLAQRSGLLKTPSSF